MSTSVSEIDFKIFVKYSYSNLNLYKINDLVKPAFKSDTLKNDFFIKIDDVINAIHQEILLLDIVKNDTLNEYLNHVSKFYTTMKKVYLALKKYFQNNTEEKMNILVSEYEQEYDIYFKENHIKNRLNTALKHINAKNKYSFLMHKIIEMRKELKSEFKKTISKTAIVFFEN